MKYQTTDFRNGLKISIDGKPYIVVYFQHVNPGKGSAFVKSKLKNKTVPSIASNLLSLLKK